MGLLLGGSGTSTLGHVLGDGEEGLEGEDTGGNHPQSVENNDVHPQVELVLGHDLVPGSIDNGG